MMKKIWLLILSVFVIFWFWVSFANPIAPTNIPDICYKLKNVEIDWYKVIIEYGRRSSKSSEWLNSWGRAEPSYIGDNREREVYEPKQNECTKCSHSRWGSSSKLYLLNKDIDIKEITQENIDNMAILIWDIGDSNCKSYYDVTKTYKITKNWENYEIVLNKTVNIKDIKKFPFFWLWAIILEILVLFYIAKLFRKENQISNKKLFLFWIIPTTVTLPLLWFVLPLFIWDWPLYTIVWELLVTIIEAIILKYWLKVSRWKAIIASIVCNLVSLFVLSYGYDILWGNSFSVISFVLSLMLLILVYSLIRAIILWFILRLSSKNDEISNKRIILVWILSPIISIIASLLLIFIARYFNLWNLLLFIAIWIYLVLELVILEYWLKISRKKAGALFIQSILFSIIILFIIAVCSDI